MTGEEGLRNDREAKGSMGFTPRQVVAYKMPPYGKRE